MCLGGVNLSIHSRDVMHGLEVTIAIYGPVFCCVMIVRSRARRHENIDPDGELGGAPARAEVCKMKLALVSLVCSRIINC